MSFYKYSVCKIREKLLKIMDTIIEKAKGPSGFRKTY
jgi:hypothetical protein